MMPAMKRATLVFAMGLMWGCVGKADPAPDNSFEFGDGGHNNKHGGAIFPDTLRWIWRDHPDVKP